VDSLHLVADVNLGKAQQRQREGKAARNEDGQRHKEKQYFYGYKDEVSLNASTGLVSTVIPGHANDYDGHKRKVTPFKGIDDYNFSLLNDLYPGIGLNLRLFINLTL